MTIRVFCLKILLKNIISILEVCRIPRALLSRLLTTKNGSLMIVEDKGLSIFLAPRQIPKVPVGHDDTLSHLEEVSTYGTELS